MTHTERVARTIAGFDTAMDRFLARVEAVPADVAVRPGPNGGWSIAAIVWHVAVTNEAFAGLVDGSVPLAQAPTEDFVETPFSEILALVPDRLDAPEKFHPPADLTFAAALERVKDSRQQLVRAFHGLNEARGTWTVKSILGRLSVYQVGDWAIAHVARHNSQAKRALGD
jgi:hypothetical protein